MQEDGFSLVLPPGWRDDTDRRSTDGLPLRLALYRDVPTGHRLIFEVHYGDGTVYPSQIGSAATRRSLLDEIGTEVHGKVTSAPDLRIDGELAVGVRTVVHRSGLPIAVRYYIPSHFTVGYPILMANVLTDSRLANQGFDALLASWRWAG